MHYLPDFRLWARFSRKVVLCGKNSLQNFHTCNGMYIENTPCFSILRFLRKLTPPEPLILGGLKCLHSIPRPLKPYFRPQICQNRTINMEATKTGDSSLFSCTIRCCVCKCIINYDVIMPGALIHIVRGRIAASPTEAPRF